LFLIY